MKLAYIFNVRLPTEKAHGIQVMKMCEAFSLNGAKVKLIIPARFNKISGSPFDFYSVKKTFSIVRLACLDILVFINGRFGYLVETLTFLISARIYLWLYQLKNGKPEILYSREELIGLFFKNYFLEIHTLPARAGFIHKLSWRRAKKLIVLTKMLKEELVKIGIPEGKILVAPDGVDLDIFGIEISKKDAREKIGLPIDKKLALYCGSFYLYGWKGVDVLLSAIKYFSPDITAVLIGGRKEDIEEIKKNYPQENLILFEHQPHGQIPYFLKAADVLILPNKKGDPISEKYTSPLKLFEYMAAKRPIVASDLPSIREVLDEKNSFLVEAGDPKSLAEGIKEVVGDQNFGEKKSSQAYDRVKGYTWKKRAEKILEPLL
ncbi:MAG: glycosyltransferase family 4 protein [Patescibacteria group bacterium]|jgi:glycosyltransferase involved in cell wall biosynthesis